MTGRLWVLGDSWADPTYGGWGWACGWPQQVAARLGWGLVNSARSGAGYGQVGNDWATLPSQAARGDGIGADVVLVWGSRNDAFNGISPAAVRLGADATYRLIRALCPDALLVVIGPQATDLGPTPELVQSHAAVRAAAEAAGAAWIDGALTWMRGRAELFDHSDGHPMCDGHAYLADRIAPSLWWLTREAPAPPRDPWDEGGWIAPWTMGVPAGEEPPSPIPSDA